MRGIFGSLAVAVLVLTVAAPAGAALQVSTLAGAGTTPFSIPGNNDFQQKLVEALGLTFPVGVSLTKSVNSDITVIGDGTISFYAVASESGYRNSFLILGGLLSGGNYTEDGSPSTYDIPWNDNRAAFATIGVTDGALLSSLVQFHSNDGGGPGHTSAPGQTVGLGAAGFAIFVPTASIVADTYTANTLYFGFDDNGAGPDDNHDDLIIRAVFTPATVDPHGGAVPEPASLVVWGILGSGIAGMVISRNRRRRSD